MSIKQLSVIELKTKLEQHDPLLLLDVREPPEFHYAHIPNSVLIPMGNIAQQIDELDKQQTMVVICHHGFRSQQVALFLDSMGFNNVLNLQGGVDAWAVYCDNTMPRY
ncbi:thiosulfate sulfurtransferase [uncultured bacterium]|nr:thiosulfate sulfurtransferase [uncultured bacterium]